MRLPLLLLLPAALAAETPGPQPATRFAVSKDGTRIAFDVSGPASAPAIMLLHGGGQHRAVWREAGYVDRLAGEFRVINVDIRGNGESGKPADVASYAIERIVEDFLAVADSAGARTFSVWGFSYGANVGRYLASRSPRVQSMVYIGIPFGAAVGGRFQAAVNQMQNRPAWISAMLAYPPVEPAQMPVPTLWIAGTANVGTMESVAEYRDKLAGTKVTLATFDGLTHAQELSRIDVVFPREVAFTRQAAARASGPAAQGAPPAALSASLAEAIVAGCKAHSAAKRQSHAIAVLDGGANLVAALRMDGNRAGIMAFALAKARAVAQWGFPTAAMADAARETPGFANAPDVVTVAGGVPVYSSDGRTLLGAVGVSGEAPADDVACAEAGIRAAGLAHARGR
jgi:glc operon protein GlcG